METSLKTGFAQIFSRCPKNLSYPKFGGAVAPLAPGPYAYAGKDQKDNAWIVGYARLLWITRELRTQLSGIC